MSDTNGISDDLNVRRWDSDQVPGTPYTWDIEKMRDYLAIGCQRALKRSFGLSVDIPFPPELTVGITESQVSALQTVFDIDDRERYSEWCWVYLEVNSCFIEGDRSEYGASVRRSLKKAVLDGDLPEAFFFLAKSWLLNRRRDEALREQDGGLWARFNDLAHSNGERLIRTLDELIGLVDLADAADDKGRSKLMLPEATAWFEEHEFREQLLDLQAIVKKDVTGAQAVFDGIYARDRHYNPSGRAAGEAQTDVTYRAVDRVAEMLGAAKGRKTRDVKAAIDLFRAWGQTVDPEALRRARAHRKKRDIAR